MSSKRILEVEQELYDLDGPLPWYAQVPYEFEAAFNRRWWHKWVKQNWTVTIYLVAVYLVIIYGLSRWMRNRKPFQLTRPLFLWNFGLAIFSIAATVRAGPELLKIVSEPGGYHRSICDGRWVNYCMNIMFY